MFEILQNWIAGACMGFRMSIIMVSIGLHTSWFGKHWLLSTCDGGQYLCRQCVSLGVIGIKLGQYLSQRPDLLAADCRLELSRLTDRNETIPWSDLRNRVAETVEVDPRVLAVGTGSLAQVHAVVWKQQDAVVKVLLPGEAYIFAQLQVCRWVLDTLCILGILPIRWNDFISDTERQLDLRQEVRELEYAYNNFGKSEGILLNNVRVRVPRVLSSTRTSIVMERAIGSPLHQLTPGTNPYRLANRARAAAFTHMTSSGDRRFHADLHDGNLLYDEKNQTLWLIDFGLCTHPPRNWEFPLPLIMLSSVDPHNLALSTSMLEALFSIPASRALKLVTDFQNTVVNTKTTMLPNLHNSTLVFFAFANRHKLVIQPATVACFMQLLVIEQALPIGDLFLILTQYKLQMQDNTQ